MLARILITKAWWRRCRRQSEDLARSPPTICQGVCQQTTNCLAPVIACHHRHKPAVRRSTDLYASSMSSADYQTLRRLLVSNPTVDPRRDRRFDSCAARWLFQPQTAGIRSDSVTAVLAQTRPALHPHCDRPRFSIRRRLFSGPATDEYEAALSRPPVCPVAVRLSETPRPK